jgi:hypothetical protein
MGTKRKKPRQPTSAMRSATGTKALLLGFERWYRQHSAGGGHEHVPAGDVTEQLKRLFELSRGRLHEPTVAVLEAVLAEVEADAALAGRLPEVIETLEHYLDFAVETGAWQGSDAQIDDSSEYLEAAYDVSTGLLLYLIDALDDVADVPVPQERAALAALPQPLRTPDDLIDRLRAVLEGVDPGSVAGSLAIERVLGLLSIAASPGLLPGASTAQIIGMLDTAAGVSDEESAEAALPTEQLTEALAQAGISLAVRPEAPAGLRAALADAVITVADELGLLDDSENAHPEGTALHVTARVAGTGEWRELLLAADSDLGALHLAVQLSFDWANTEEHRFTLADDPGVVYASVDPLGDPLSDAEARADDVIDENEVELGELFAETGDELEYRYGAADLERRVGIRLERVEPPTDTAAGHTSSAQPSPAQLLPRCTGASAEADAAEADRLLSPLRLTAS